MKPEYLRFREKIQKLRLLDDFFMSKFFDGRIEETELVLRIILDKADLHVQTVKTEYDLKSIRGRSVRLDVYASDSQGKHYDIEVQRADAGAVLKRARYNHSLLDANITAPGDDYEQLPDTYVIFITENDVLGYGLPIYHLAQTIQENGKVLDDGAHTIYVNAANQSDTQLGKLMADFRAQNYDDMYFGVLAKRAQYLKGDKEGVIKMCQFTEEVMNEGRAEGSLNEKHSVAAEMIRRSMSVQLIQDITKLSLDRLQELSKECGVALVM